MCSFVSCISFQFWLHPCIIIINQIFGRNSPITLFHITLILTLSLSVLSGTRDKKNSFIHIIISSTKQFMNWPKSKDKVWKFKTIDNTLPQFHFQLHLVSFLFVYFCFIKTQSEGFRLYRSLLWYIWWWWHMCTMMINTNQYTGNLLMTWAGPLGLKSRAAPLM